MAEKQEVRAIERLIAGNDRFVEEVERTYPGGRSRSLLSTQKPYAVVLTCADSRVVPELIFDESIGRLFVIRVAGNIPGKAELGSIEYAVDRFDCAAVLVLGHTMCGAVALAMSPPGDGWEPSPFVAASPAVQSIVERVQESLETTEGPEHAAAGDAWDVAVRRNVKSVVEDISTSSIALVQAQQQGKIAILGAVYDVRTGRVEFLDE